MQHVKPKFQRDAYKKHDKNIRIMLFQQNIVLSVSVIGTKTDERAFRVALDILSCKQCLGGDSQIFEHHDFASRSPVNFLAG